jgi:hypothetical protein
MATQTFSTGATARIALTDCTGDLLIEAWDERSIAVEAEEGAAAPAQEGETLAIRGARGSLRLRVPGETAVTVQGQGGAVHLRNLYGAVVVDGAGSFRIEGDGNWRRWLRAWRWNSHDVEVRNTGAVDIDYVIGNLTLSDVQSADARAIGGNATAQVVKGDLRLKNVGGSSTLEEVGGDLEVGNVGGNCEVRGVEGSLRITNVGGNADVRGAGAVLKLGNVGGNLTLNEARLSSAFAAEQPVRVAVGGNARLELPDQPSLTINAVVGGSVTGEGVSSHGGGMLTLVYGAGGGRLSLMAGGNLELRGGGAPQVSGMTGADWSELGHKFGRTGRELGRIGRELGREFGGIGRDMGREFGGLGRELGREFADMGREIGRAMAEAFDARRDRANGRREAYQRRGGRRAAAGAGLVHFQPNDWGLGIRHPSPQSLIPNPMCICWM